MKKSRFNDGQILAILTEFSLPDNFKAEAPIRPSEAIDPTSIIGSMAHSGVSHLRITNFRQHAKDLKPS